MHFTGYIFYQQSRHNIPPIPFWYNNTIIPLICQFTQYPCPICQVSRPCSLPNNNYLITILQAYPHCRVLRLDPDDIKSVEKVAERKGFSYTSLLRMWIKEH